MSLEEKPAPISVAVEELQSAIAKMESMLQIVQEFQERYVNVSWLSDQTRHVIKEYAHKLTESNEILLNISEEIAHMKRRLELVDMEMKLLYTKCLPGEDKDNGPKGP